jgi:hypothetical protein
MGDMQYVKLCECGCGQPVQVHVRTQKKKRIIKGQPRRFVSHHSNAICRVRHGMARNGVFIPEYSSFHGARNRCNNKNYKNWEHYGGRGIKFLFKSFEDFFEELGPKPEPKNKYSLDRINNDGNYEKGNVRWSTNSEQQLNKRKIKWTRKRNKELPPGTA